MVFTPLGFESLSEGLFDVIDDAQMGMFWRPVVRRDSLGKDTLSSPNSRPAPSALDCNESVGDISTSENATEDHKEESLGDELFPERMGENVEYHIVHSTAPALGNPDEFRPGTLLPRIRINGRSPVHSTPKSSTRGKG